MAASSKKTNDINKKNELIKNIFDETLKSGIEVPENCDYYEILNGCDKQQKMFNLTNYYLCLAKTTFEGKPCIRLLSIIRDQNKKHIRTVHLLMDSLKDIERSLVYLDNIKYEQAENLCYLDIIKYV